MTGNTGITGALEQDGATSPVNALAIISNELMETIRNAHLAVEDCVDGRGGSQALLRAGDLLHQARGALQLAETYGAALLVEEMELACRYLAALRPGKGREDGLDALTRSMVQLPSYVERLLGGGRDIALVLLPLLNDLRAARGEPLLSEGTLLLLNLSPSRSETAVARPVAGAEDPVTVARRLRPKFQLALLGWIQGGNTRQHLESLSKVTAALQNSAPRDDMYQLWWVTGGVLESLREGGLDTSVALKRLLAQADRQIKFVIDEGIEAFDRHPVDDLLNNLLYYVARSSTAGQRISEIRSAFNLAELLPGDEQVEHAREALSAPSVKLMKTVAAAIKEDLARVKDVLDIFVRTGMNKSSELVPQLELLKKISDTLGVLGLGELRSDIDGEIIVALKGFTTMPSGRLSAPGNIKNRVIYAAPQWQKQILDKERKPEKALPPVFILIGHNPVLKKTLRGRWPDARADRRAVRCPIPAGSPNRFRPRPARARPWLGGRPRRRNGPSRPRYRRRRSRWCG